MNPKHDPDPQETREWVEALEVLIETEGAERAHFLLEKLIDRARRLGAHLPYSPNTAYLNTLPAGTEERSPGDAAVEWRLRSLTRWNAMAMVVKANRKNAELGGHIASFASSATLYDVGFNHFFRGIGADNGGDLLFVQGHSAPGFYARAFLEGHLQEEDLDRFRQEIGGGLPSYPHPRLLPNFWHFPTVSMGLGPLMAIYQARFMRYLEHRGITAAGDRKIWAFMGDGEMDEPEAMGAIGLAGREKLDNLLFVVNCNLQRLDGPVRGNGKIIQELEAEFRGAGWNVIKVIWGSYWDPLLARDTSGLLYQRMEEVVDGDYQAYKAHGGDYVRRHFFGKYPELKTMVSNMSDDDIWRLNRGGHDPHKVYGAYAAAVRHQGQPTVILAKTVKGYGMGEAGEGQNITHQQKKMGENSLKQFRDRFNIPISDQALGETPFYRPPEDSEESRYLRQRREALGGPVFARRPEPPPPKLPSLELHRRLLEGSGKRSISTTMAFTRILDGLLKDEGIGPYIVPIIPDEARTFGMEGLFRRLGIYSSVGQLYDPVDHEQVMYYREDQQGQILEEGITEAGAISSWIAAGTAYKFHGVHMIPFYTFYSMFGFQRVGDLCWAAGDMQARGFLIGGTAGRTTLSGEGLQHQDGHSHLLAATIPCCVSYDPTYSYELAIIIQDGLRRMYGAGENVFYYITVMNENYPHPPLPKGAEEGILRGMYRLQEGADRPLKVQLLGSGAILREVCAAAELLAADFQVSADVWSVTSFTELRREGLSARRWNMMHPGQPPRRCWVEETLENTRGPVVAASDYMMAFADQIRPFLDRRYVTLGTDGFGRSGTRAQLRSFFEVDRHYIAVAALKALADEGEVPAKTVAEAIARYRLDADKPDPAGA
ncbi:MAG: pyruvate dehydrogenase (acetyl-transferring), homodimeric type [Gammaproteobacteria bacterium]|nr:pyruvate dehydrogenase (acetyl-transferring), homodimeric type [Gammaproteobacteria bacterium]